MTRDQQPILLGDLAQVFLMPYLEATETLFRKALKTIDGDADCRILPAADLGIPHEVTRLAGGFATGCFVDWQCKTPVIPVDTTVNVDTSSIFLIRDDISRVFNSVAIADLVEFTTNTSYVWNFNKGNHFISFARRRSDGHFALILHSNEKEFKYQANGLVPVPGNWFTGDLKTWTDGDRYIRLLIGDKATHFALVAKMLEDFTVLRHRFFALQLCGSSTRVVNESHSHHYYMPTASSVALGVYLCREGEVVPVFSRLGHAISLFRAEAGGENSVQTASGERLLVPHGWGKTSRVPMNVRIGSSDISVNGRAYPIIPKASIGNHPDLDVRDFSTGDNRSSTFFDKIAHWCRGTVVDEFDQLMSYSSAGVVDHREP